MCLVHFKPVQYIVVSWCLFLRSYCHRCLKILPIVSRTMYDMYIWLSMYRVFKSRISSNQVPVTTYSTVVTRGTSYQLWTSNHWCSQCQHASGISDGDSIHLKNDGVWWGSLLNLSEIPQSQHPESEKNNPDTNCLLSFLFWCFLLIMCGFDFLCLSWEMSLTC